MDDLFPGESEPIADDPILRGVDLAMSRLIQRDCFTDRTLRVLDELRAEVLSGVRADWYDTHCPTCDAPEPTHTATCAVVHAHVPEPGGSGS